MSRQAEIKRDKDMNMIYIPPQGQNSDEEEPPDPRERLAWEDDDEYQMRQRALKGDVEWRPLSKEKKEEFQREEFEKSPSWKKQVLKARTTGTGPLVEQINMDKGKEITRPSRMQELYRPSRMQQLMEIQEVYNDLHQLAERNNLIEKPSRVSGVEDPEKDSTIPFQEQIEKKKALIENDPDWTEHWVKRRYELGMYDGPGVRHPSDEWRRGVYTKTGFGGMERGGEEHALWAKQMEENEKWYQDPANWPTWSELEKGAKNAEDEKWEKKRAEYRKRMGPDHWAIFQENLAKLRLDEDRKRNESGVTTPKPLTSYEIVYNDSDEPMYLRMHMRPSPRYGVNGPVPLDLYTCFEGYEEEIEVGEFSLQHYFELNEPHEVCVTEYMDSDIAPWQCPDIGIPTVAKPARMVKFGNKRWFGCTNFLMLYPPIRKVWCIEVRSPDEDGVENIYNVSWIKKHGYVGTGDMGQKGWHSGQMSAAHYKDILPFLMSHRGSVHHFIPGLFALAFIFALRCFRKFRFKIDAENAGLQMPLL